MADWPTDKELEEIYRKGSEHHDFQYSAEAWEDMEGLLDKERRRRFFIILLFSAGLISLLTILYSTSSNNDFNQTPRQEVSQTAEQRPVAATSTSINPSDAQLSESTNSNSDISLEGPNIKDVNTPEISANADTKNDSKIVQNNTATYNPKSSKDLNDLDKIPVAGTTDKVNTFAVSAADKEAAPQSIGPMDNSGANTQNAPTQSKETVSSDLPNTTLTLQANTLAFLDRLTTEKLNYKIERDFKIPAMSKSETKDHFNRLLLSALISAESSWTTHGEFSRIDVGLGLKTSHFLNRKLAIDLGATYVNDVYTAEKGDYNPKNDFFKANDIPEYTSADCSMIELSTGASYYFSGINRNGFSTSIHLLSNFMLKENYNYHYTEEGDNFSSSWSTANQTWLNAVDISANYKFNLTDRWILETGPFLKVPLAGIGHGQVMLSSIGIKVAVGIR